MSLEYGFSDRMQAARDAAAYQRHKGTAASRPKYAKRPPAEDTPENRLYAEIAELRSQVRERDNTIAVLQSGGSPDDFGSEFDRLFSAGKQEGPGLPAEPHATEPRTLPSEGRKGRTMTTTQYLAALKKLGLTPAAKATAEALGLSVRQCQRIAAGDQDVPETLAKLLRMYLEHGLPE